MTLASILALSVILCSVQSIIIGIEIIIAISYIVWPIREITEKELVILLALSLFPGTAILALIYMIKLRCNL